jgi:2-methylcitrate dehydratase PrpD
MEDVAERLVDHALDLDWATLPEPARRAAAVFLHDTLSVGIAGARAWHADAVAHAVGQWGQAAPGALVLGRGVLNLPPASAAFLNAFQIHGQEFDCVHEQAVVHPLATIVAALLAALNGPVACSGAEFLTALCAGVDVATGLGLAATAPLTFFRPATAGIFGSVAAIARLRRLKREQALDAFGTALGFAAGTMQAHIEGMPTLPLQIAAAARSAVCAVDLAVAGLPGPRGAIDGKFGYLALFEQGSDTAPMLATLATIARVTEISWKPFPTGRAAHGAIVATTDLAQNHGVTATNLERLTYTAPPLIHRLVGRPARAGMTPAYARLCFPYLGAVVLLRGTVGLGDFTQACLTDPAILALAARIEVVPNNNLDPAAFTPAEAVARFADGAVAKVAVTTQFGSPAWPLSRAEHLEKSRACLAFAGQEDRHEALAALMEGYSDCPNARVALEAVLAPSAVSGAEATASA